MEVVQRRVSLAKLDEEQDIASQTNVICNMCMNIFNKKNIKYNDRGPICFSCEGLPEQKQESESR
jgi:formylmethanofuran dehydrogenase subunit E